MGAEEADRQYDEAQKKMQVAGFPRGERRESRCQRVQDYRAGGGVEGGGEQPEVVGVSEDKANQRESFYKSEIKRLTTKLKQSETRSEFAEKSVVKLQKEVDRLEDEL